LQSAKKTTAPAGGSASDFAVKAIALKGFAAGISFLFGIFSARVFRCIGDWWRMN
jgi:hypothetical protein